jgi:hypothetical protein
MTGASPETGWRDYDRAAAGVGIYQRLGFANFGEEYKPG